MSYLIALGWVMLGMCIGVGVMCLMIMSGYCDKDFKE